MKQTYPNIECIVIDDCGQDKSMVLAEQHIAAYQQNIPYFENMECFTKIDFKILRHEHNRGLSAARNTGTNTATGDYIFYLDSDDEITPDCIETLLVLAEKYMGVEMVQGNIKTLDAEGKDIVAYRDLQLKKFPEYTDDSCWIRKHFYSLRQENNIPMNAVNRLISKKFIVQNKLLFEEDIWFEDELWTYLAVNRLRSVVFCLSYTYSYNYNPDSIMRTTNRYKEKILKSWSIILPKIFNNLDLEFEKQIKMKYLNNIYYCMYIIQTSGLEQTFGLQYKEILDRYYKNDRCFMIPILYIKYVPRLINCLPSFVREKKDGRGIFCRILRKLNNR
jgi:glycosyltransferase involved in cell wall biosynthesis